MPRKPMGERALTQAEKDARQRDKRRRIREALETIRDHARTIHEAKALARKALESNHGP